MNLKTRPKEAKFKNISDLTKDNTFKIENSDTFNQKSRDKFENKNSFMRNQVYFCFNIPKNNCNSISPSHTQFKKEITDKEIDQIKKEEKKNNTYSFNEVKSKLKKELEKEKEIVKQEKEIEELKKLKIIIAIKLFSSKMKRKIDEEKAKNYLMNSSEETKNYFNNNDSKYQEKYDTSGPSKIQIKFDLDKYQSTESIKNLKILNFSNN